MLLGALGLLHLPSQPVEVLIAGSVLASVVHAIRPVFPGRERAVAAGFGLVYGLAFATVLANLELSTGKLALSVLGFNLGIEIMQMLVIISVFPWLILLSNTPVYKWVRTTGAALSGLAAMGWILERTSGKSNVVAGVVDFTAQHRSWLTGGLAATASLVYASSAFFAKKPVRLSL